MGKIGDALKRDVEQAKSNSALLDGKDLNQDAGDTIRQMKGDEPVPPEDQPLREDDHMHHSTMGHDPNHEGHFDGDEHHTPNHLNDDSHNDRL